jgi:acetoin utilization protein AcuB
MFVRDRMNKNPVTVTLQDTLAVAHEKMIIGQFRHLPVVQNGNLVGILTDRDLRHHVGTEARTRVGTAMTEEPLTVSPLTTVEAATRLLLRQQIGGLPVVEARKLVGIITTSDVMQAFLDLMGASAEGSVRLDVLQEDGGISLSEAAKLVSELGGEVLGVGVYRDTWRDHSVFYLRLHGVDPEAAAAALQGRGHTVLGVHP